MVRTLFGSTCVTIAVAAVVFFSPIAVSQQISRPVFNGADVHASVLTQGAKVGPLVRGGLYELRNATLVDLISTAYGVETSRVAGGPSYLEWDRFDVIARVPSGTGADAQQMMLQSLLADRFKLTVHRADKPTAAYALTNLKNPKLSPGVGTGDEGCKASYEGGSRGNDGTIVPAKTVITCSHVTMAEFASQLPRLAQGYMTEGLEVLDQTDLKGTLDLSFKYSPKGEAGSDYVSFFDALDKQLGLALTEVNTPQTVIVVDSVSETPTDNAPGMAESLAAGIPKKFEVADVKQSDPGARGSMLRITPDGSVTIQNMPLRNIFLQAFAGTAKIQDTPDWMNAAHFDITAKPPQSDDGTPLPANPSAPASPVDRDAAMAMLRTLLIERFKITTHEETQMLPALKLVAVKPKIAKADPSERTRYFNGVAPGAVDPRVKNPARGRVVTVQNMTMKQFATVLGEIAPGYVAGKPVTDATGLEGSWDFTLNFSNVFATGPAMSSSGGVSSNDPAVAPDPTGAISFSDAVEQQAGLKLEGDKQPVRVLVIDHIERLPTEN